MINKSIGRLLCLPFENPGPAEAGPCQKRASSRFEAGTSGLLSISDSEHRVPTELGQESQASSCVEEWNSTGLSSCSPDNRPLVELCVEPAVLSGRCMGVSVPLRFCLHTQGCLRRGIQPSDSYQEQTRKSVSFGMWHHPQAYVSNFFLRRTST